MESGYLIEKCHMIDSSRLLYNELLFRQLFRIQNIDLQHLAYPDDQEAKRGE